MRVGDNATPSLSASELDEIIKPLPASGYSVDYDFNAVERMLVWLAEGTGSVVELCPDFQRGHVWTEAQQVHFIENVLRGIVPPSGLEIKFNAPAWHDDSSGDLSATVQCIDGLQRLTAVRRFMDGEIRPFGLSAKDLDGTKYMVTRGARYRLKVSVFTFQNRKELLQYYVDSNAGGTPHSTEEIERVKSMIEVAQSGPVPGLL